MNEEQMDEDRHDEEGAVEAGSGAVAEGEAEEAPAGGPRLVLKRSGQETDIAFEFTPPATIGRFDPDVGPVDVDLTSIEEGTYVSRKHAVIVLEEDTYKIQDLGSSNGTYVLRDDFEKVDEAVLSDGDEIALGNARFVFHV